MNAVIIQQATPGIRIGSYRDTRWQPANPAILQIDGVKWESPLPENSGEAQSFNEDGERIVERVRAK